MWNGVVVGVVRFEAPVGERGWLWSVFYFAVTTEQFFEIRLFVDTGRSGFGEGIDSGLNTPVLFLYKISADQKPGSVVAMSAVNYDNIQWILGYVVLTAIDEQLCLFWCRTLVVSVIEVKKLETVSNRCLIPSALEFAIIDFLFFNQILVVKT